MNQEQKKNASLLIKRKAKEVGFSFCGISKAGFLEDEAPRIERWLTKNMHGQMGYMANHFDKRLDPTLLVPGAKSVISLLYNYYTDKCQTDRDAPKISKYAYGRDYHKVVKKRLQQLLAIVNEEVGIVDGRAFVDSAPVLEKAWASKSGLGWVGKNTNLINKQMGSFFFCAELIVDLELEYDENATNHCGDCTACIDACPTGAIEQPYVVNGSKCISYYTIELKEEIPEDAKGTMDNWMFGCDVCQDVCPWNRFSLNHNEPKFEPKKELLVLSKDQWNKLNEESFDKLFEGSAVKRTKFSGLKRNIEFLNK